VKKLIDVNQLLSLCSWPEESVCSAVGWLLLFMFAVSHNTVGDEKEHPDFEKMKGDGTLEKIYSLFKECKIENAKRFVGLTIIDIDRKCSMEDTTFEVVEWLRDKTNGSTADAFLPITLINLCRLVHRFFYPFPYSYSILLCCLFVFIDCPERMFNLGIHSFALQFLKFVDNY
jgi:hypothetical protein